MFTEKEFAGYGDETVKHDGIVVKIIHDDNERDSSREWDNLGTMATWHRRYRLGDEQPKCTPIEHMVDLISEYNPKIHDIIEYYEGAYFNRVTRDMEFGSKEIQQEIAEIDRIINDRIQTEFDKYFISLPVYMYEHSGITISTGGFSCPWDSGQLGFIYVSKEKVRKEYGWKNITKQRYDKIVTYLSGEIKTYDQYLTGDVWAFQIGNYNEYGEFNCIDSCYGFYGREYAVEGAVNVANYIINEKVTA